MTFNMRNFADVLAKMQGGIRLEPGRTYSVELTEEEVKKIFGEVPAARVGYGLTFTVNKSPGNKLKLSVKINE